MTEPLQSFNAESISLLPEETLESLWQILNDDDAALLNKSWRFCARKAQLPPDGRWRIWLFLGGRGAGKTRAGAEWIADGVCHGTMRRIGLIGATFADAR